MKKHKKNEDNPSLSEGRNSRREMIKNLGVLPLLGGFALSHPGNSRSIVFNGIDEDEISGRDALQENSGILRSVGRGRILDLSSFGVKGDGSTDDTAAIQKALDETGKVGGTLILPAAKFLVAGSLTIPPGVSLEGVYDSPMGREPLLGTVILATGGRDNEDGPALFEMGNGTMVRGLTIFYPEQDATNIRPYSWTFHLKGWDGTVENLTIVNTYNAIKIGPENNQRHRIRSVVGCALRRGILVDNTRDIGRIENIQWHCDFWMAKGVSGNRQAVHKFMRENLEAFIFGRTDWEYVTNTFVFPCNIGYRFIKTTAGMCNGQFLGIGADEAQRCVSVEHAWGPGVIITNGEFVCMHGKERIGVVVEKTCTGSVRLVNCAFWGPSRKCVESHSSGYVSLSDCYIEISGKSSTEQIPGVSLVESDNGQLQVRGCSFGSREPNIVIKKGTVHAIITENNGVNGVEIINEIGEKAIIANNRPFTPPIK